MKRRLTAARLLTVLCLLALLVLQAVGGFRAYVCECGGQVTLTRVDHCHGPHSVDCHDHESSSPDGHDEKSGDRQDHKQIVQELRLRSVENFQVPAIIPVLLTWMPEGFETFHSRKKAIIRDFLVEAEASPPLGVCVARTVVFII